MDVYSLILRRFGPHKKEKYGKIYIKIYFNLDEFL